MSEKDSTVKAYLAEHPKMTGVLFTLLLLTQTAGTAVAGESIAGP